MFKNFAYFLQFGAVLGSCVGGGIIAMANWIRLQPPLRGNWGRQINIKYTNLRTVDPLYHLGAMIVGGCGGYKLSAWRTESIQTYQRLLPEYLGKEDAADQATEELDSSWRQRETH